MASAIAATGKAVKLKTGIASNACLPLPAALGNLITDLNLSFSRFLGFAVVGIAASCR